MIFFSNPLYGEKDGNLFLERIWMEMELLVGDIASALQRHFWRESDRGTRDCSNIFMDALRWALLNYMIDFPMFLEISRYLSTELS